VSRQLPADPSVVWELVDRLDLGAEMRRVDDVLAEWLGTIDREVRPMVERQLGGRAKRYRPATVLVCYRANANGRLPENVVRSAAAVELLHNVSLIIDDILDRSRFRRGMLSLHCRFGFLPALMTSGYMGFAASALVADDGYAVRLLAELMQRLGVAECVQWRLRRHPLGIEDWRAIANEDTGSMFEICARLGSRDERLAKYGQLVGLLYHGCDDVADVRGAAALGGGNERDIADGILTLPAAIAIRDPGTALLFEDGSAEAVRRFAGRLQGTLDEAEAYLDGIADAAEREARDWARSPAQLLELVAHTRELSRG
jgi:geranylgeranyl pyrophosphate synthase